MKTRLLHGGLLLAAGVVTGCGGLTSDSDQWTVTLTSPVVDDRVPFCPAIVTETDVGAVGVPLDGSFAVPAEAQVSFTYEKDDIYTFSGLTDANFNGIGGTMTSLFAAPMRFDMGPIGSVYDLEDPVVTPWFGVRQPTFPTTGINVTRTLVGGGRKADDKVELVYDYSLDCETIAVTDDSGTARSCDCERQTFTYAFEAKQ